MLCKTSDILPSCCYCLKFNITSRSIGGLQRLKSSDSTFAILLACVRPRVSHPDTFSAGEDSAVILAGLIMEAFKEASSDQCLIHLLEGPLSASDIAGCLSEWMEEICTKVDSTTDLNTKLALLKFTSSSITPRLGQEKHWTQRNEWTRLISTCCDVYKLLEHQITADVNEARHVIGKQLECLDLATNILQASHAEHKEPNLDSPHGSAITHCLHMVDRTFQHCRLSESFYSHNFTQMADTLATTFRKSFALLKSCIPFLDGVSPHPHNSNTAITLTSHLTEISETSCSFDGVCLQTCWKTFVRFAVKFKNSGINSDVSLRSLASATLTWFTKCISIAPIDKQSHSQPEANKQFAKAVKALRFMFSLILKLCNECEEAVHSNIELLFNLALKVESCGLPAICPPKLAVTAKEELETNILPVIEPLTGLLISHTGTGFVSVLRKQGDIIDNQQSAHLRFLIRVIDLFPTLSRGIQDALMDRVSSFNEDSDSCVLLDALFSAVTECYVEFSLPVYVKASLVKTKPLQDISLYELVSSFMCSFVAQLPARYFVSLEQCLLRQILSDYPHSATLATDIWCFVNRWGSAELCRDHIVSFSRLLVALPVIPHLPSYQHICLLVQRLFPLLAVPHQLVVIDQLDPSIDINILRVWKEIPLKQLSEQALDKMLNHLPLICSQHFDEGNPCLLYCSLQFLTHVLILSSEKIAVHQKHLLSMIETSMSLFDAAVSNQHTASIPPILDFLSAIMSSIQPAVCQKIIQLCTQLVSLLSPPTDCLISVTKLLSSLGRIRFPSAHAHICLHSISCLFQNLLPSSDWFLHHHTLIAFQSFAQYTPHSEIIQGCVPEHLKAKVADFVRSASCGSRFQNTDLTVMRLRRGLEEFRKHNTDDNDGANFTEDMVIEQSVEFDIHKLSTTTEVVSVSADSDEPMEKKKKVDDLSDSVSSYRHVVDSIITGIGKLQELMDNDTGSERLPPAWLASELATAREQLRKLVKQANYV